MISTQPLWAADCTDITRYVKNNVKLENTKPHPCGKTFSMCISKITETTELSPAWAYELSTDGKLLEKWPLPVDAQVWSIAGTEIFAAYPNQDGFENSWTQPSKIRINPHGKFSAISQISESKHKIFECSKYTNDPNIKQAYCHIFRDLKSSKERIIAFEPVCT